MTEFCYGRPAAIAQIQGGPESPRLSGTVTFFPADTGTIVVADVAGLPMEVIPCAGGVLASISMRERPAPARNLQIPAATFYPGGCRIPIMPGICRPSFPAMGRRIWPCSPGVPHPGGSWPLVVIHSGPDDFTTQPAGNSWQKIACGVIRKV